MNLKEIAESAIDTVASNPKTAVAVPFGTGLIAPLTDLVQLQSILSIISMIIGIVISLVIFRHRWISMRTAEIRFKRIKQEIENEELDKDGKL